MKYLSVILLLLVSCKEFKNSYTVRSKKNSEVKGLCNYTLLNPHSSLSSEFTTDCSYMLGDKVSFVKDSVGVDVSYVSLSEGQSCYYIATLDSLSLLNIYSKCDLADVNEKINLVKE